MAVVSTNEPMAGLTWFLRCGECETMYVPTYGFFWREGRMDCCWTKPRPVKKPMPCSHTAPVQRWNGTKWEDTPLTAKVPEVKPVEPLEPVKPLEPLPPLAELPEL